MRNYFQRIPTHVITIPQRTDVAIGEIAYQQHLGLKSDERTRGVN